MNLQEASDLIFLALTVWREARGEPAEAQKAVAASILNRVRKKSWWGRTVQDVVTFKFQYSSMTLPDDPQLTTWPKSADSSWHQCLGIASSALEGRDSGTVGEADSYFDDSILAPAWTKDAKFVAKFGKLNFYNVDFDYQRGN